MGVEHSFKEESDQTMRCPVCGHVSTLKSGSEVSSFGYFAGLTGEYFYCQNPNCKVEKIYSDNCVLELGSNSK